MNESPLQPKTITKHMDAVYPAFALHAAMKLEIFTHLDDKPLSARELSRETGTHWYKLQPVLFILVQAELLNYANELFSNTPETDAFLVKGKPGYIGGRVGLNSSNWKRMLDTAEILRAGKPEIAYDDPASPEDMENLFRGLYAGAVSDAKYLIQNHDFSDCKTLLDVGGGSGGLGITFAREFPHLNATIMDLPSVTPLTEEFVRREKMGDRVEVVTADAVNDALQESYDVVVARHLVQVLSSREAGKLLSNLAGVLKPGKRLFIIGNILDNSRQAPPGAVNFNLVLITSLEFGEAYTEQEYQRWLDAAGFGNYSREVTPSGTSILSVTRNDTT